MTDSIYAWSTTAFDNGTADSTINFAEQQPAKTVNNSARALMARVAELLADIAPSRSSTGSGNGYSVTSEAAGAAYEDGEIISFIPNRANTSAATLDVNGRGAKPWRPAVGVEFVANNILTNVPVTATYRAASDEWLSPGTGYYVTSTTSGVALQSITATLPRIGDMVISMAPTAAAGRIRLTEAAQAVLKSSYPELNTYLSSISYPWGSTTTHFNLPPAAGYFLRFAPISASVDPSGARGAGVTQWEQVLAHTHAVQATGFTTAAGAHSHTVTSISDNQVSSSGNGAQAYQTQRETSTANDHIHAVNVNGTATSTGGTENRVKNVAFHVDIIASTAAAAAQVAVFGFPMQWDTGTTAVNPGAGRVRCNNATPGSATELYASTTDGWGVDISGIYAAMGIGNVISLSKVGAQATRLVFRLSAAPTAGTGFYTMVGTVIASGGTLSSSDQLALESSYGITGPTGAAGSDGGVRWKYSSSTSMTNPGTSYLRLNNSAMASVTELAIANACGETGNPDVTDHILAWDDSTSTTMRGTLTIRADNQPGTFAIFQITSAITDSSGWNQMTVAYVAHAGTFVADELLSVQFARTGDKGADGAGAGTVTSVTAGPGLSTSGAGGTGGAVTASGTLTTVEAVNIDSTQNYTYVAADHGKLVVRTYSSGGMSDTLPAVTGSFAAGFFVDVYNAGGVLLKFTAASTINGLSTYSLNPGASVRFVSDGTTYRAMSGGSGTITAPQGRLTLTSATAIMSSSVTGATTVYYTPAVGRYCPIYDGSRVVMVDVGGELSQLTTDTTKSPAAASSSAVYDIFVWQDGTTYRATRGPAWTTSTSRGTGAGTSELTTAGGILVNANAITNGPAASRGTYVGSIRTNASSTVDYKFGSAASGGGYISFGVWNAHNQTLIRTTGSDSTASWSYASTTVRNSNNSANNSASFLCGLSGSPVQFDFGQRIQSPAAGYALIYVYLDGAATGAARSGMLGGVDGYARVLYNEDPGIGWHTLQCKENCSASSNFIAGGAGADMQFSLSFLG